MTPTHAGPDRAKVRVRAIYDRCWSFAVGPLGDHDAAADHDAGGADDGS